MSENGTRCKDNGVDIIFKWLIEVWQHMSETKDCHSYSSMTWFVSSPQCFSSYSLIFTYLDYSPPDSLSLGTRWRPSLAVSIPETTGKVACCRCRWFGCPGRRPPLWLLKIQWHRHRLQLISLGTCWGRFFSFSWFRYSPQSANQDDFWDLDSSEISNHNCCTGI